LPYLQRHFPPHAGTQDALAARSDASAIGARHLFYHRRDA
jgi:hypothetical protein